MKALLNSWVELISIVFIFWELMFGPKKMQVYSDLVWKELRLTKDRRQQKREKGCKKTKQKGKGCDMFFF